MLNRITTAILTLELLVIIAAFSFVHWTPVKAAGAVVIVAAMLLLIVARRELGRSFSVRAKASHLVTTGVYARIRNPNTAAVDLHGVRQQVAVGGDLPERLEVGAVPQRPFPPTRRTRRIEPKAIAALLDLKNGWITPLARKRSPRIPSRLNRSKTDWQSLVKQSVREEDRDVELTIRQAQPGAVTGVFVVKQVVAAEHALVDVLGGEIEMVIVIPQRTQRLGRVAGRPECRVGEAGEHVRIMLVLEAERVDRVRVIDRVEVVDRVAVAFRRRMAVVQMGGHLGDAEGLGS